MQMQQSKLLEVKPDTAGRVFFLPEVGKEFLFFQPSKQSKALKILEHSMWFKNPTLNHGICYRASTSLEAIYWLKDNMGTLMLDPLVHSWIKKVTSIVSLKDTDNICDLPLYDFQREAVGFLIERSRCMLSLSPGLGKTLTSITAASLLGEPAKILVVAPLSLLYMWMGEIEKWGPYMPRFQRVAIWHQKVFPENLFQGKDDKYDTWIITNVETATKKIVASLAKRFDILILDESILYKSRNSKRTKGIKDLAKVIPIVWELTGAPANRMVDDLWSQFNILKPKAYSSYWRFSNNYCLVDQTGWGNKVAANKLNTEQVIKQRFADIYFARSQDEVLNIPDWIFEPINVKMTAKQEKVYEQMAKELWAVLQENSDGPNTIVSVTNHLTEVLRLIQIASNPMLLDGENESGKWEALPELMQIYPGPFIVWTNFKRTANYMREFLERMVSQKIQMITGEVNPATRQQYVDSFQAGYEDILVINSQIGSKGLTLTKARTVFYIERNYLEDYYQSLHRVRRIGTEHSPIIVNLMSVHEDGKPTIDALVDSMLDYRIDMAKNLTTGMLQTIL